MANFTGAKCEYCKKVFEKDDDIVVCPECGTPYHRECYNTAGECVNYELHNRGEEWQTFHGDEINADQTQNDSANGDESQEFSDNELKCPRCGQTNPPSGLFCVKCGYPLTKNQEERPFNETPFGQPFTNDQQNSFEGMPPFQAQPINLMEEEIGGHKGEKYVKFVKKNPVYYLANFFNMHKRGSKGSYNISAFLFPEYFFFYRKMYVVGVIMLLLATVLEIPTMLLYLINGELMNVSLPAVVANNQAFIENLEMYFLVIRFVLDVVCGIFGNYWYFKKAKKTISQVEEMDITDEEKNEIITQKGGTSGLSLAFSITANVALVMLLMIIMVLIFR